MPMLAVQFIMGQPSPALSKTYFASIKLGPGPKNGNQSFPNNSALEILAKIEESTGGEHSVRHASAPKNQ